MVLPVVFTASQIEINIHKDVGHVSWKLWWCMQAWLFKKSCDVYEVVNSLTNSNGFLNAAATFQRRNSYKAILILMGEFSKLLHLISNTSDIQVKYLSRLVFTYIVRFIYLNLHAVQYLYTMSYGSQGFLLLVAQSL